MLRSLRPPTPPSASVGAAHSRFRRTTQRFRESPALIEYRRSSLEDVPAIVQLIEPFVQSKCLLPRSDEELAKLAGLGFIAVHESQFVGFAAVEIYSRKLAELQCLAVAEGFQGRGIGKRLVQLCIELSAQCGVHELMAITASDKLFQDVGFDYSLPNQKRALFIHPLEQHDH